MKFDSETYNKIYHAPEADNIEAGGGVVEPQAKPDEKEETTDGQTQRNNDINVNINVSSPAAEVTDEQTAGAGDSEEIATPAESED